MSLDKLLLVSADCHAGASVLGYREYLDKQWLNDFDAWAKTYKDPFEDLGEIYAERNWDSSLRRRDLEKDGLVAEVIFPNTPAPFHPVASDLASPPSPEEYQHRRAGAHAYNRWLSDFCSDMQGRRAGIAEILFNNPADAVADIKAAREMGLFGGIMMPPMPPGNRLPPIWDSFYDPIWSACVDMDIPINHHGGGGTPDYGYGPGMPRLVYLSEFTLFSNRIIWHMAWGGVFERHPNLRIVITEQGFGMLLDQMWGQDHIYAMLKGQGDDSGSVAAREMLGEFVNTLPCKPSEYIRRNCWIGASFMSAKDAARRHEIGVDHVMWGADYPHTEATTPNSRAALQQTLAGIPEDESRAMVGLNAAKFYGFDLELLNKAAAEVCPDSKDILVA